jgi:hypothetical protein
MRKCNFALRLQPSLLEEARKLAQAEGVALNQLINAAVAEKLSALRTESYFAERARVTSRVSLASAIRCSLVAPPRRSGGRPLRYIFRHDSLAALQLAKPRHAEGGAVPCAQGHHRSRSGRALTRCDAGL